MKHLDLCELTGDESHVQPNQQLLPSSFFIVGEFHTVNGHNIRIIRNRNMPGHQVCRIRIDNQ